MIAATIARIVFAISCNDHRTLYSVIAIALGDYANVSQLQRYISYILIFMMSATIAPTVQQEHLLVTDWLHRHHE